MAGERALIDGMKAVAGADGMWTLFDTKMVCTCSNNCGGPLPVAVIAEESFIDPCAAAWRILQAMRAEKMQAVADKLIAEIEEGLAS